MFQTKKVTKKQVAKLLDPKRSQALAILVSSQHLTFDEIEEALVGFDASVLSLETLQTLYLQVAFPSPISYHNEFKLSDKEFSLS